MPTAEADHSIEASFAHCRRVARRRAANFYYGMKLTPEPKRSAIYAVYAFMRACDDLADGDEADPDPEHCREQIQAFRDQTNRALQASDERSLPEGPLWPALRYVMQTYPVDPAHLHQMLDGQLTDLVRTRYETFEDLQQYCHHVASTVGLVCISIWGHDQDPAARQLASYRGLALQLTNILRDLSEDAQRDRLYLPREEMRRFGYALADLRQGHANSAFDRLMNFQIERARGIYEMADSLESHLHPDGQAASWTMMRIYRQLLQRIAENPRAVLSRRIRLGFPSKLRIAAGATWRGGGKGRRDVGTPGADEPRGGRAMDACKHWEPRRFPVCPNVRFFCFSVPPSPEPFAPSAATR